MTATAGTGERSLNLTVRPEWDQIARVRERCNSFFKSFHFKEDLRDALCMVASELLENAVKYGDFQNPDQNIEISIEVDDDKVTLEVKSPLDFSGEEENMRRLDSFVQWIRGYQSPFQAYLERLRLVAAQPLDSDESGLGLVRIAYEGEAILDFYVTEEDCICISAIFSLNRK